MNEYGGIVYFNIYTNYYTIDMILQLITVYYIINYNKNTFLFELLTVVVMLNIIYKYLY